MLKLLGKSPSINVRKVLWLCAEMQLAVEREEWGSGFRSTQTPEFLALNPNALVPVLVDGVFVLWDNAWHYAFMSLVRKSPAHADPQALAASVAEWTRLMQMLDAQIAKTGAFAAGDTFTLADIVLGLATHRWLAAPIDTPHCLPCRPTTSA